MVSDLSDHEEEARHLIKALTPNGYKKWSFEIPQKKEKTDDPFHDHIKGIRVY